MDKNKVLRQLPKIDSIMENEKFSRYDRTLLKEAARASVDNARERAIATEKLPSAESIIAETDKIYTSLSEGTLKKVINATGVPIHTNLGRAPIPESCFDDAKRIICGYSNLEFDIEKGKRGDRYHHASTYLRILTGAEDAVIVNNNASAVFLILNTLSNKKEAIVSRGELVEIGGSFRVPDVMKQSGAKMCEVGATNKTRLSDYTEALNPKTAVMMKVHKSNYEIIGFSEETPLSEIASAAKEAGVISYYDAGSGLFTKILSDCVCADRPIAEIMKTGVDLISFSGDKMMGGCQAGIIAGRKDLIAKIKKNPLMRMLRVDKMTLAVIQSILRMYITGRQYEIPVNAMLSANVAELRFKAEKLKLKLKDICQAEIIMVKSTIGGGSCPTAEVDSFAVEISLKNYSADKTEKILRNHTTPIIARRGERVFFDIRTLNDSDFDEIVSALRTAL